MLEAKNFPLQTTETATVINGLADHSVVTQSANTYKCIALSQYENILVGGLKQYVQTEKP